MSREPKLAQRIVRLLATKHLLSAGEILNTLNAGEKQWNKTSVYRALDRLVENGDVCQHYFHDSQAVYELSSHHHAHVFCKNCGIVVIAECDYAEEPKVKNFQIDHHHLTLIGICQKCAE